MALRKVATERRASVVRTARILLVEDDQDHLDVAREILEDEGYVVESAVDGPEALDKLQDGPRPDLAVIDLHLPRMDGWQLVAAMRESPRLAEIPVVVMTGAGEHALTSAPVSAGYLAKPLSRARLLETVAVVLARAGRRGSGTFRSST